MNAIIIVGSSILLNIANGGRAIFLQEFNLHILV